MTVAYDSSGRLRPFGFARLIFRWKASIWKAIWVELLVWTLLFLFISFCYRLTWGTRTESKATFEKVVQDWQMNNSVIPVTFVLGFYTTITFNRWWKQFELVPWIDSVAFSLNSCLAAPPGHSDAQKERLLIIKRGIVRYLNLASGLVLQSCSQHIQSRFPDLRSLQQLGLLTAEEKSQILETPHDTHPFFLGYSWAHRVIAQATDEGFVRSPIHAQLLLDRVESHRQQNGSLLNYKWIAVPLLFTQVVTCSVYVHFMFALIAEQFLDPSMDYTNHGADWFLPFFSMLKIVVLVGWLKAAELMKSPFGHDDDSFPIEWIMRRNVDVGFDVVSHQYIPTLERDQSWNDRTPANAARFGALASGSPSVGASGRAGSDDNNMQEMLLTSAERSHMSRRSPSLGTDHTIRNPNRDAMIALRAAEHGAGGKGAH